jgi:hypothetical protein
LRTLTRKTPVTGMGFEQFLQASNPSRGLMQAAGHLGFFYTAFLYCLPFSRPKTAKRSKS